MTPTDMVAWTLCGAFCVLIAGAVLAILRVGYQWVRETCKEGGF